MLKHRVIPCLLILDNGLVKTTRFTKPKYVGDPINAIRIFSDKEVDELFQLRSQTRNLSGATIRSGRPENSYSELGGRFLEKPSN